MVRFLKYAAAATALLILLGAVAGALYLNSSHFEDFLRSRAVSFLEDRFAVRVEIGRVQWTIWENSVRLENLRLFDLADSGRDPAIDLPLVTVDYSILSFLQPKVSLDRLEVIEPRIRILDTDEDRLNLSRMFIPRPGEGEGRGLAPFLGVGIRRFHFREAVILYRDSPFLVDSADGGLQVEMTLLERPARYGGRAVLRDFALKVGAFELPRFQSTLDFELFADSIRFPAVRFESEVVSGQASGVLESLKERTYEFESRLVVRPDRITEDLSGVFSNHEVSVAGTFAGRGAQYLYSGRLQAPRLDVWNVPLDNLTSTFRLDRDSVVTEDLSARVAGGRVGASGELSWDDQRPSTFRVSMNGARSRAAARILKLDWFVPEASVDFEGRAEWPGTRVGDLKVEGVSRFRGFVDAREYARGEGSIPFQGESPLQLDLKRLVLNESTVTTPGGQVLAEGWVDFAGSFTLETNLTAEPGGELLQRGLRWEGAWKDRIDPLAAEGPAQARVTWSREEGNWRAEGQVAVEGLSVAGQMLGALESDFLLSPEGVEFDTARLVSTDYEVEAGGRVSWEPEPRLERLQLRIGEAQLSRLAELAQLGDFPGGRLSGQLELLQGDEGYQASGRFEASDVDAYGQSITRITSNLSIRPQGEILLENLSLAFEKGRLTGRARLLTSGQGGDLSLRGDDFPLEEIVLLSENLSGPAKLEIELALEDPVTGLVRVEAPRLEIMGHLVEDFLLRADTQSGDPGRAGYTVQATLAGQPFLGSGQLGLAAPYPITARTEFTRTPLESLLSLVPLEELPPVQGTLTGDIELRGNLGDWKGLQGQARFPSLTLSFRGVEVRNENQLALDLKDETLTLAPVTFLGRGTQLEVEGTLGLAPERTVQLKTKGSVNLLLLNPFLDSGSLLGGLQLETVISGPLAGPRIVGEAQLERGFLHHPSVPTTVFDSRGRFRFTADQVSIDNLEARTIYGPLRIDGGVFLEGFTPVRWLLNVYGDSLRLEYPENVFSTLDVDLDLIKSEASQLLSGRVVVQATDYRENVSLPELILRYGTTSVAPPTLPGQEVVLDIDVEGYQTLRVQNNLADLTASGDLHIRGTLTNPVILGTVTVDEGKLFLENNEYEINRGAINFNNPRRTRPVFNFEAQTEVRDISVNVLLNGPIDQLNMSVRSDPPLPSSSIISLLALGQTDEEILGGDASGAGPSGSLAIYGAGALLSKSLGQRLQDQTSRLFGFEKLSIDPFLLGSERDPGARVTLGKQLGRNLSVTYSTVLGSETAGQVVVVELKLTDWLSAVGTGEQSGAIALDFKLRKRF